MNKKKTNAFIRQLEKHRGRIADERDSLRELLCDVEELLENTEHAVELIEEAIDKLSELT